MLRLQKFAWKSEMSYLQAENSRRGTISLRRTIFISPKGSFNVNFPLKSDTFLKCLNDLKILYAQRSTTAEGITFDDGII